VELVPFDGIQEKVATAITSGKTPDVFLDNPERVLGYANMGVIAPLNDVIPEDKLKKIQANPDIMNKVAVNGDIVSMPWTTGVTLMMVNKTLWKNVNAEHLLPQNEERTWTPEQFLEALRAVKDEKKGIYGITLFALNEQGDQFYNNVMAGFGVKLFNPEHTKYIAGEDPAALEAMKFFQTIVDENLSTPYPETLSSTNALDYFNSSAI
jgi:multiple sugar transport system substrate-binding protein